MGWSVEAMPAGGGILWMFEVTYADAGDAILSRKV